MALTREFPPFEDPGGRKGVALRRAGFLYDPTLDVFAYRAAGKIALRTSVEGRSLPELQRFIDEAPPLPGRYQIFAGRDAPVSLDQRRSLVGRVGLDELAQRRRLNRASHPGCPSRIEEGRFRILAAR